MRVHTPGEIGLLVLDARRARGWTQARLAEAVGATRQWVRGLESGKPRLELGLTLRALNTLDLALNVALPDERPPLPVGVPIGLPPQRRDVPARRPAPSRSPSEPRGSRGAGAPWVHGAPIERLAPAGREEEPE